MKRLLILIVLLMSGLILHSQPLRRSEAIYMATQPADLGIGIRLDYYIVNFGMYSSVSYGNWGVYSLYGLEDHVKFTTGVMIPLKDWDGWKYAVNGAVNYHYIGSYIPVEGYNLDDGILNPWSFELGLTVQMRRFAVGLRTDILRWEPCVDIGIPIRLTHRVGRK